MKQTLFAKIIGALLLLLGILSFIISPFGLSFNPLLSLIYLAAGALGIWAGVWGGAVVSRWYNRILGIAYALLALLGFVAPGFMASLLSLNIADNWLHPVLALIGLGIGFFA